ncbi:MAG: hypothetical protein ACI8UO_005568 [Verrucomicrobiales bacterium]|jgi:hypothetical protein
MKLSAIQTAILACALTCAPVLAEETSAAAEVFGIPIKGDVLIVIVASSTMDEPFALHSRLGVCVEEVIRGIENLPAGTKFNVAAVDEGLHWNDGFYQLHPATAEHKNSLITALEQLETGEGSNFEIALALPIVFTPRPTQVVLISDGSPETFAHVDEIEKLVEAGIRVDCVGFEQTRREAGRLREIAHPSGGKFNYADPPQAKAAPEPEIVARSGIE